jgi:hypothetical protein
MIILGRYARKGAKAQLIVVIGNCLWSVISFFLEYESKGFKPRLCAFASHLF